MNITALFYCLLSQAYALKDTPVVRVLLNVALHAPLIKIPYSSKHDSGTLHIDLGTFRIQNQFLHGYETSIIRASVVDIGTAQTILDRINIECSSLQVYRWIQEIKLWLHYNKTDSNFLGMFTFTIMFYAVTYCIRRNFRGKNILCVKLSLRLIFVGQLPHENLSSQKFDTMYKQF